MSLQTPETCKPETLINKIELEHQWYLRSGEHMESKAKKRGFVIYLDLKQYLSNDPTGKGSFIKVSHAREHMEFKAIKRGLVMYLDLI